MQAVFVERTVHVAQCQMGIVDLTEDIVHNVLDKVLPDCQSDANLWRSGPTSLRCSWVTLSTRIGFGAV